MTIQELKDKYTLKIGQPVMAGEVVHDISQLEANTQKCVGSSLKMRWHDLRKDPLDLPKDDGLYLIAYIFDGNDRDDIDYTVEMFCRGWHSPTYVEVIAWKHFEPFEEETE